MSHDSVETLEELTQALASAVDALQQGHPDTMEGGIDFYEEVRRFEVGLIERALRAARGQQARAARFLGLKKTTLNAKVKLYGIECRALREPSDAPARNLALD